MVFTGFSVAQKLKRGKNKEAEVMMTSICGRKAHVTLEFSDGTVLSGATIASQVSIDNSIHGFSSWEVVLTGTGAPTTSKEVMREVAEAKERNEWRCPYCGRIYTFEHCFCIGGCGAPRPMLYGEIGDE